jgi:lantibiotic biosynthesis protein
MKSNHTSFQPSGFFVLRTPLLPLLEWLDWSKGLKSVADYSALIVDRNLLRLRLYEFLERTEIKESLFLATPQLYNLLKFWYNDPDSPKGQRIERSLTRYFARMAARSTPFGLFAGGSCGILGAKTNLSFSNRSEATRYTHLDSEYLSLLVEKLRENEQLQKELVYRPNTSLYKAFGRFRYVKENRSDNKNRSYHLVAVENTKYLTQVIENARDGVFIRDLVGGLVSETVNFGQASLYISNLIKEQIIVPDLQLVLTGIESAKQLANKLRLYERTKSIAKILSDVCSDMELLDNNGIGNSPQKYYSIAKKLEKLSVPVEISRLFQVDLVKNSPDAMLGTQIIDEIQTAIRMFHRLARDQMPESLRRFIEQFTLRYEQQSVPLLEALDEESGIGFDAGEDPNPLIKDFQFPIQNNQNQVVDPLHFFMLNKLVEVWQNGKTELVLAENELEQFTEKKSATLPDAFTVNITLAARNLEALNQGDFQIVWHSSSGPSGARLFGRFCHVDAKLEQNVRSHLRAEEAQQPDAVFAEIVHLPTGRMGNILSRPILRDYEIVYLGGGGAANEKQIPVNDLLVSVRNKRVELYSKKLGRQIIPRLTSAHNYWELGLGVYRFLCLLQNQEAVNSLAWDWGLLSNASFLPRLRIGKIILSLAKWNVTKQELEELKDTENKKLFLAVQKWRQVRKLPRLVNLADGDNVLSIDFDNILSVESFVHLVKNRKAIVLSEFFPTPELLCVESPEGMFTHEIAIPFVKQCSQPKNAPTRFPTSVKTEDCSFPPGSKWLYTKLYTGKSISDQLLIDVIPDLIKELKRQKIIEQWFFVRYEDPDWHLRLRLSGNSSRLRNEAQPLIEKRLRKWIKQNIVRRIQYDTYEREIERYGGLLGIELSEQFFHADSDAVLGIIGMLAPGDAGLDERWRLTCAGIDLLLNDFGLSLFKKHELMSKIRDSFAEEHAIDKAFRIMLGEKYRKESTNLAELLKYPKQHSLSLGLEILHCRSIKIAPIIKKLQISANKGKILTPTEEIITNYLHMYANRLLRASQRQQELVIYDLLTRHYGSLLAQDIKS